MNTNSIDIRNILRPILLIAISLTIGIGIGIGISRANNARSSVQLRGAGELDHRADLQRVLGLHEVGLRVLDEGSTREERRDVATHRSAELRLEDVDRVGVLDRGLLL